MIIIKSKEEIERIRKACWVVAKVLEELKPHIKPGVTTGELETLAVSAIEGFGGKPAFKGYRGFPGSICTSINEVVVHGIPGKRRLRDGDIIGLDIGVKLDGYFGDGTATFPVGDIPEDVQRLVEVTKRALEVGLQQAKPENRLANLSHSIQRFVESRGFQVVRDFVGHGVGLKMHEEPEVPNFGQPNLGPRLKPGMVLAIEPMVNMGSFEVEVLKDGWTVVTKDRKPSCHFEHVVAVTEEGPDILTRC